MNGKFEKLQGRGPRIAATVIAVAAIVVIPLTTFRSFTNKIVDQITQTISYQYSQELNAQMTAHISSTIDYYFHELNTQYHALKHVENLNEEKLKSFISDAEENNGTSYVAFGDTDGYIYEVDGAYLGTMRISILGNLLAGGERVITDNVTVGNEDYIIFGSSFDETIPMGNKTISIGLFGMDSGDLAEHVVLYSDYSGGYSSIIHTDGSYIIKNSMDTKGGLNVFSILAKYYGISDEELNAIKTAINSGETYFFKTGADGVQDSEYMYFSPISGTEWYIVNTLPSSFIKSNIVGLRDTLENIYIIFVVFFLIIAAVIVSQQMISSHKLRRSRAELADALKIAQEASEAKTNFLFSMSHDIRTPMNAILGYTDIGLKHVDDTKISEDSYKKIKMAGGHLLDLINDILEMSRIESNKVELSEDPIDIRDAIAEVTTMSQSLAVAKSIDFETVIGEIRNPYIYADELHINEVIINLISNAVKYTPIGGKVKYTIHQTDIVKDGKSVFHFEISDNGIGMSEDFQQHLFETFSREENTTISKVEGTGLGLSIVKRIVEMTGGDISVQSVRNQGSIFTVEIPFRLLDEHAIEILKAEKKEASEITGTVNFAGKKVLLAEDNELNNEIATYILQDAGLEVESVTDGSLAVNAVIDKGINYYDFILMDIQMPVMDGYEATRKIRKIPGGDRIPVIALSANAFEEDKQKSIDAGMNAHVAKPIDIKVLLETIQELLR